MMDRKAEPEIRFKGFTDSWEQRKLGDCFSSFEARTYNPTTGKLVGEYVLE